MSVVSTPPSAPRTPPIVENLAGRADSWTAPGEPANHVDHVEITWGTGADRVDLRVSTQPARVGHAPAPLVTVNRATAALDAQGVETFNRLMQSLNDDGLAALPKLPVAAANAGIPAGHAGVALLFNADNTAPAVGADPAYYNLNSAWSAPMSALPAPIANAVAAARELAGHTAG